MEIVFRNVTLFKSNGVRVLDGINFKLTDGNIYAFVGRSGSGKTSICELINFLEVPSRGLVRVGSFVSGGSVRNLGRFRSGVGYVYKRPRDMFVCSSVRGELELGLRNFKYRFKDKEVRLVDALRMVGLDSSYLDMDPLKLSLNVQKRVALACVLIFNPRVLIIDEPSVGLNNKEKKDLVRLLKLLKKKYNKVIILMSKDTDFLYEFVDYVYILNNGKVVSEGKKDVLGNIKLLKKCGIKVPQIVSFINSVRESGNKLEDYDNIKDLIKGVYRSVR